MSIPGSSNRAISSPLPYFWKVTNASEMRSSEDSHWQDVADQQKVGDETVWLARQYYWEIEARMGGRKYVLRAPSHQTRFYCSMRSRIPLYGRPGVAAYCYFVIGMVEPGRYKTWIEIDPHGNASVRQIDLPEAPDA